MKTCLAVLVLCGLAGVGLAQAPAPPAPAAPGQLDPARNALDAYLMRWEDAMRKVDSLAVACNRTELDPTYKTRKTYTGTIHFVKPTYFFWHMAVKDKPQEYERFVCTGTHIYQYVPAEKLIKYYPAPKTTADGKLKDDSSLAFLFGMKAAEAKNRYDLKLHNIDENYVYIDVIPRADVDKADFIKARLILSKTTLLPRQLWFQHPNEGEVLWDLTTVNQNVPIKMEVFDKPQTPKDWKLVPGQADAKPRVVRPQQGQK